MDNQFSYFKLQTIYFNCMFFQHIYNTDFFLTDTHMGYTLIEYVGSFAEFPYLLE